MATSIKLSKITKVDLRDCWNDEAKDFTPWLATEENIALLAETLGLNELEIKGQEEQVGPFRADILCVDSGTNRLVLIENQLEKTDHKHLGQIMTYAAGLDAVTIIWIAESFTEEHRAAIDWLNRITDTEFNFFGVEVELIKIGDSPAAPVFNVIAKPNGWSKDVRSSQASAEGMTKGKMFNYEYWSAFVDYMKKNPSNLFQTRSATHHHWMNIAIGKSGIHIALLLNKPEQKATIQLYMSGDEDKTYFDALYQHKDEAEKSIGVALDWRRLEERKASTIDIYKKGNLSDPAQQEAIFSWYREFTEKYIKFFKPLVKKL